MGFISLVKGHGWDGTKETPAERHFRTMQEEVAAWKAKWDARPREDRTPTLREQIRQHPGEVERWQHRGRDQGVEW
jgi:hypothetical protein